MFAIMMMTVTRGICVVRGKSVDTSAGNRKVGCAQLILAMVCNILLNEPSKCTVNCLALLFRGQVVFDIIPHYSLSLTGRHPDCMEDYQTSCKYRGYMELFSREHWYYDPVDGECKKYAKDCGYVSGIYQSWDSQQECEKNCYGESNDIYLFVIISRKTKDQINVRKKIDSNADLRFQVVE